MTGLELDEVRGRVDNEGFHYAFIHYSDFDEVKDKKFHKLRKAYIKATNDLATYIGLEGEGR